MSARDTTQMAVMVVTAALVHPKGAAAQAQMTPAAVALTTYQACALRPLECGGLLLLVAPTGCHGGGRRQPASASASGDRAMMSTI